MRISDWSSDVCSSDLLAAPDRPIGIVVLHQCNEHILRPNARRPGQQRCYALMELDPGVAAPAGAQGDLNDDNVVGPSDVEKAGIVDQILTLEFGNQVRSEEHTSDLQ